MRSRRRQFLTTAAGGVPAAAAGCTTLESTDPERDGTGTEPAQVDGGSDGVPRRTFHASQYDSLDQTITDGVDSDGDDAFAPRGYRSGTAVSSTKNAVSTPQRRYSTVVRS